MDYRSLSPRFSPTYERVRHVLRRQLGLPAPLIDEELVGRVFRVRRGTIRKRPDYDDAWLLALACHAERVLDVGSNIGQAALLMLRSATVRDLVLVEPNPSALALAAETLIRNQLSHTARFVPAFMTAKANESLTFWTVGTGSAGSRYPGHAVTASRKGSSLQVRTLTVDALCSDLGYTPDLVKIDVEGAEHEVLMGSEDLARAHSTRFLVEMHSPPELPMADNADRILRWCATAGFTPWYLAEQSELTSADQIGHRGRCHLLLQPAAWEFPTWLEGIEQAAPLSMGCPAAAMLR